MKIQSIRLSIVALAVVAVLAGCRTQPAQPAGPTVVQVRLTDFKIELDKDTIPAGPVKFMITNASSATQHEMVLEPIDAVDKALAANGKTAEASDIDPGKTSSLEWTLDKPGKYRLACHKNMNNVDHFVSGMKTEITVQ